MHPRGLDRTDDGITAVLNQVPFQLILPQLWLRAQSEIAPRHDFQTLRSDFSSEADSVIFGLLEEAGVPEVRSRSAFRLLQFLESAQVTESDARYGSRHRRKDLACRICSSCEEQVDTVKMPYRRPAWSK